MWNRNIKLEWSTRKWESERGVEEKGNEGKTKKKKWVTNKKEEEKIGSNIKTIKAYNEQKKKGGRK